MRRPIAAAVVSAVLVLTAVPAGAVGTRVYFKCDGSKLANFDRDPAGWSNTPPQASVAEGGGCGYTDVAGYYGTIGPAQFSAARFSDWFSGPIGSMNVRLDTVSAGTVQAGQRATFDLTLRVDGRNPFGGTRRVSVQPIPTASPRFHSYFFSVADLPYADSSESGLHHVELVAKAVDQPSVTWVYGSKETPSGIEFNPLQNHPVVIRP